MNEKTYKLKDICSLISKGSTPRGKVEYAHDLEYPFLRVTDIVDFSYISKTDLTLSEDEVKKYKMKIWPKKTVVISIEGTVGKVSIIEREMTMNQAVAGIVVNEDIILPEYLMYYLKSKRAFGKVIKGTIMPAIRLGDISNLEIEVPNLEKQHQIVNKISIFDKIILNTLDNNERLIQIIQKVYDDFFEENCSDHLVKDIASLKNGFAFKGKDFSNKGIPVIKIKNVKPYSIVLNELDYIPEELINENHKAIINYNDILITMTGNRISGSPNSWVGKVALFNVEGKYLLNQRLGCIIPKEEKYRFYLFMNLASWNSQVYFIQRSTSSGGQSNISPDTILNKKISIPDDEKLEKFNNICKLAFKIISKNNENISYLIKCRDVTMNKLF